MKKLPNSKNIVFLFPILIIGTMELLHTNYYIELVRSLMPIWIGLFFVLILPTLYYSYEKLQNIFVTIILSITGIALMIYPFQIYAFYSPVEEFKTDNTESIKIVSANLWWQNKDFNGMKEFIKNEKPDLLALIEYTDIQHSNIKNDLTEIYPYSNVSEDELGKAYAGNVIFSKYPIIESTSSISRGFYSGFEDVVIDLNGKELEIYIVHTTAPISEEYFGYRNDQLIQLANSVNESKISNIIVTGDFNISPWSYFYKNFDNSLRKDITNISGKGGFEFTWSDQNRPFIRSHIDHMFTSESIDVNSFKVKDFPGSDHRALIAELTI